MSPGNNQEENGNMIYPSDKWANMVCFVILVSLGMKFRSWSMYHDLYQSLYIEILSIMGISWLIFIWIDLKRTKTRLLQSLDTERSKERTYYTYLKAPHSYCVYLKIGLSIFCFMHLILTTTLIVQEAIHYLDTVHCFIPLRLFSSLIDLISSLLQLFFIQHQSNIIINRYQYTSRVGCMFLCSVGILKWYITIAADSMSDDQFDTFQSYGTTARDCQAGNKYRLNLSNLLSYIDPFTIEFNFLLAIQWLIIWQHIGRYKESQSSDYWLMTEPHGTNKEITDLALSIKMCKSGRGLFAGIFCLFGALISLVYYFSAVGNPNLAKLAISFTKWEDLIYLTASLLGLFIATLNVVHLGNSTKSCIGSTDLMLLFFPLVAFCIHGYIKLVDDTFSSLLSTIVEILGIIQPILQAAFIYFAKSKVCDSEALNRAKPGRQIITLLIALNLVIWVGGAFRGKAKLFSHNNSHITHSILLDICQPFILFYRYHASVCLANIWQTGYS